MKKNSHRFYLMAAFSLPEVTISMGIVAVLMLPALAMLAAGGAMETSSRDRETASHIVSALVSGVRGGEATDHCFIDVNGGKTVRIDLPATEAISHLLFDEKGRFLTKVGEGEYEQGIDPAGGGRYLVRLRLSGGDSGNGLRAWDVKVEQPAAAARLVREAEIFQTRLTIP